MFMLANLIIQDAAEYRIYEKGFFALLKRHGGEFLTFDDNARTLEGSMPPMGRLVIFKLPSEAHAERWFADPDYQSLSAHRRRGTNTIFLTMLRSLPPRT